MISSNKRKINLLLFFVACIFISVAATKPTAVNNISKPLTGTDTGLFKNLKILPKDISKDSLDHIMHHFSQALGVRCNFCHAMGTNGHPDFASDDKEEKNIARYMMTMTAGINKTYFNSENSTMPDTIMVVKCATCHHGNPHPDETNMGDKQDNMQPPPMPGNNNGTPPPPHQ